MGPGLQGSLFVRFGVATVGQLPEHVVDPRARNSAFVGDLGRRGRPEIQQRHIDLCLVRLQSRLLQDVDECFCLHYWSNTINKGKQFAPRCG